jgi:hypothetical protein
LPEIAAFVFHISERIAIVSSRDGAVFEMDVVVVVVVDAIAILL